MIAFALSIAALFISLSLLITGSALLGTLVTLRLDIEGFSEGSIGIIMATYSLGFVFGAMWSPGIIRAVGHIRAFCAFAAIACAGVLWHPLMISMEVWITLRLLVGFCLAGLMTVTESWINDRATNASRGKLLGIYTIVFYLAASAGQLLVGFGDPGGMVLFSFVAMLMVLSLVPLALTRSMVPTAPTEAGHLKLLYLLRKAPSGVTGSLVAGMTLGAFLALAPLYALRQGLDMELLALYMALSVLAAIVLQWPAGWLSDRIGRLPVLTGLLVAGSLAAGGAAVLGGYSTLAMFVFSAAFFSLGSVLYPVAVALTNDQLRSDQLMAACAELLRTYGVGAITGPLAASFMMQWLGAPALFMFISLVLLGAGLMVHYIFRTMDEVALDEQGNYVPVTAMSTAVLTELDPRNEEFAEHHSEQVENWDEADELEYDSSHDDSSL